MRDVQPFIACFNNLVFNKLEKETDIYALHLQTQTHAPGRSAPAMAWASCIDPEHWGTLSKASVGSSKHF